MSSWMQCPGTDHSAIIATYIWLACQPLHIEYRKAGSENTHLHTMACADRRLRGPGVRKQTILEGWVVTSHLNSSASDYSLSTKNCPYSFADFRDCPSSQCRIRAANGHIAHRSSSSAWIDFLVALEKRFGGDESLRIARHQAVFDSILSDWHAL